MSVVLETLRGSLRNVSVDTMVFRARVAKWTSVARTRILRLPRKGIKERNEFLVGNEEIWFFHAIRGERRAIQRTARRLMLNGY